MFIRGFCYKQLQKGKVSPLYNKKAIDLYWGQWLVKFEKVSAELSELYGTPRDN